jgi:hypothetical protein
MTRNSRRRFRPLLLLVLALLFGGEALAIIGRPLTPISVAGVARRTARRSVYY